VKPGAVVTGFTALLLLTGCSISGDGSDAGTTTGRDPSNLFPFGAADTAAAKRWLGAATAKPSARRPVKKVYGVFRRPQTSHESKLAHPCSMAIGGDNGKPSSGLRRLLLRDVGPRRQELIAQPTANDELNLGLTPDGGASCRITPLTTDGLILGATLEGDDALVYGMVGDGVVSVDLVVDGALHHARLGENAFAAVIPGAIDKALERMILRRADGSVTKFPPG
jgi:hypothetical protein